MADAAISFAVQKLREVLINKVKFLIGVEDQVRWLKDELQSMQCFLKDAAEKQGHDERIRQWISDVRDVAQDAEDVIEIFTLKIDAQTRKRDLVRKWAGFPSHVSLLNIFGNEIESIRTRLNEIAKRRERYGIGNLGEEYSSSSRSRSEMVERQRRMAVRFQKEKEVVGLNEDADLLLNNVILNEEKQGLSLALIVGMGGIGKSTLARKIYDHPHISACFEKRVWVVVSNEFEPEDIMKQIMHQLSVPLNAEELKTLESIQGKVRREEMLQEMLRERLAGKCFFIVLDDMWEDTHWQLLKNAFPDEQGQASRLLFTSRKEIFTKHHGYIHKMKVLNPNESWELLLKTAFIGRREGIRCPQELEETGRNILEKCHGLPLAITVAGGLLVNEEESKTGWRKVLKQVKNYDTETNEIAKNVSAILELSYHNLPSHLKPCFLCLAFFKEDEVIQAKRLVHIWVALGLIKVHEAGEETVEEIARRYLDELINRNLVQVKELTIDDRVRYCKVHDLLHELSIKKAKEEIGFESLISEGSLSSSSSSISKPRHRVVRGSRKGMIEIGTSNKNTHVRSLFIHVEEPENDYGPCFITPSHWKGFELLRILDIQENLLSKFPSSICSLIGIRYLRLREENILFLPSWLDALKNLEILDLASCLWVEFPNVTWKMDNLRHLYMHGYICTFPDSMKKSSWNNLETLKYMPSDAGFIPIQRTGRRLRKLGIHLVNKEEIQLRLGRLLLETEVQVLHLRWEDDREVMPLPNPNFVGHVTKLKLNGPMERFPNADMFPQNITQLTISQIDLWIEECIHELGKLPNLLLLKLDRFHLRTGSMKVCREGFLRLKVLHFSRTSALQNIEVEEGGMPQLQRLEFSRCYELQNIDNLREHIKPVEIVIIVEADWVA